MSKLTKPGFKVVIQSGAGYASHFLDSDYIAAGATIVPTADAVWYNSNLVMKLRPPTVDEATQLGNKTLISLLYPAFNTDLIQQLSDQKATVFAMDCIPRTLSRGQTYDVLSRYVLYYIDLYGFFLFVCLYTQYGVVYILMLLDNVSKYFFFIL